MKITHHSLISYNHSPNCRLDIESIQSYDREMQMGSSMLPAQQLQEYGMAPTNSALSPQVIIIIESEALWFILQLCVCCSLRQPAFEHKDPDKTSIFFACVPTA